MEKFYFITHFNNNPYYNIASEEYLLRQKEGNYIYIWQNEPSVIVGVNQNTLQEVNLAYVQDNGIKVVRRQTGGGAVYHDLGNICYTVVSKYDEGVDNYKKFTAPVIEYLNSLGVKAEFSGRNDITVGDKKISGNAQTVYNGRVLHHGTLLFDTDLTVLSSALNPNKLKTQSKGIKSVRARVCNISEFTTGLTAREFFLSLGEHFKKECEVYQFSKEDEDKINELVQKKYGTYEWNIGYSPKGKNRLDAKFDFGILTITFDTENGVIKNAEAFGDFFSTGDVRGFFAKLNGVKLQKDQIISALEGVENVIKGASAKDIVEALF